MEPETRFEFFTPSQPDFNDEPAAVYTDDQLTVVPARGDLMKLGAVTYRVVDVLFVMGEFGLTCIKYRLA